MRPRIELTAWTAAALYFLATAVWSWPLLPNLTTSIGWDLGDPMLLAWIMGWVNDSILALFRGDTERFLALWDPPIFHPEPLGLAFSDHLIPQSIMVLPLYALTGNLILCYNVALLTTFVLGGVGMFLLTRELTGSALAGLIAGALFAFTPYRVDQLSHLQVLSSQWMPLALFGLRRYFTTLELRPLVWAVLALTASSLSCGYYVFYFPPFVAAYALVEMASRGYLRQASVWTHMVGAAVATVALTLPFLIPYLAARETHNLRRTREEIQSFSADIYAYVTSSGHIRWSSEWLDAMRHASENVSFPGLTILILVLTLLCVTMIDAGRRWRASDRPDGNRAILWTLLLLVAASAAMTVWIAVTGGKIFEVAGSEVRLRNFGRLTLYTAVLAAAALAVSPRLRDAVRGHRHSMAGAALLLAFMAFMLSLGRRMESRGTFVGEGPYGAFMLVPGVDGLRVPSRLAMVVVLWLSLASGYVAARIHRVRYGAIILGLLALLAVAESRPRRFLLDGAFGQPEAAPLDMLPRLRASAPVYEALGSEPRGALIELPWGRPGWDIQFMHLQRRHGWPLVNGYSGHFPESYFRTSQVDGVFEAPDRAWWALERSGASHVIVHEWAFVSINRGKRVSEWLRANGAVEVAAVETDRLFRLPGGIKHR